MTRPTAATVLAELVAAQKARDEAVDFLWQHWVVAIDADLQELIYSGSASRLHTPLSSAAALLHFACDGDSRNTGIRAGITVAHPDSLRPFVSFGSRVVPR